MTDPPPPSPLVSPDLRRQLQQRYEQAARLSAAPQPDRRRIHELLAECLRTDPGNILYLDALLANLRHWRPKLSWLARWFGRGIIRTKPEVPSTQYPVLDREYRVLQGAPDQLLTRFSDPALLRQLAAAAAACDFDQAELRYLAEARRAAPNDSDILRLVARALTRQGQFESAAAHWQELLAAAADDAAAMQALADLNVAESGRIEHAEHTLADEQARGGPLLSILEQREALQLARAEHRLAIARRLAASDPHPKAQSLPERLQAEHQRLLIEILHVRCERLPGDWQVRVELARRLKAAGNYGGAVQRLDEALRRQPASAAALLELGECWQHLRQFAKALDFYREAIAIAEKDELSLARYRSGVLAAAMGLAAEAREHFTRLIAADPGFPGARERLDNLPGN